MYEITVAKLKVHRRHVPAGNVVSRMVVFKNEAVKIALWYYTCVFLIVLLRCLVS